MVKIQADFFVRELENDEERFLFLKKILNGSRDLVFLGFQEYIFWLIYETIMTTHLSNSFGRPHNVYIYTIIAF